MPSVRLQTKDVLVPGSTSMIYL